MSEVKTGQTFCIHGNEPFFCQICEMSKVVSNLKVENQELRDAPPWIKNIPEDEDHLPIDGEYYIIAVEVRDNKTGRLYWQIDQVQAIWYEDGLCLMQGDDSYTDWNWEDVNYYMKSETDIKALKESVK